MPSLSSSLELDSLVLSSFCKTFRRLPCRLLRAMLPLLRVSTTCTQIWITTSSWSIKWKSKITKSSGINPLSNNISNPYILAMVSISSNQFMSSLWTMTIRHTSLAISCSNMMPCLKTSNTWDMEEIRVYLQMKIFIVDLSSHLQEDRTNIILQWKFRAVTTRQRTWIKASTQAIWFFRSK